MKHMVNIILSILFSLPALSAASDVSMVEGSLKPTVERTLCVFDILGKQGDNFGMMMDYRLEAVKWRVKFRLKAYTNEAIATEDFRSGHCDAVNLTGLRVRSFNSFTGTLDSIGSLPSYRHLEVALEKLALPEMKKYMTQDEYEVVGILPGGAGYLFVNDRALNSVDKLLGKKIAVLDYDKSQEFMVASLGASPVSASVMTLGPLFNNGAVDLIGAPAVAFEPLELAKGLGDNGAIGRFPLGQLTYQIIVHADRFPPGYGQSSREYFSQRSQYALGKIRTYTERIPERLWMDVPDSEKSSYSELFRKIRLTLRDKGFYNPTMLRFLRLVRCSLESSRAECVDAHRD